MSRMTIIFGVAINATRGYCCIFFENLRQFLPPCDYAVHSPMIQNITPQNAPASVPYRRTGPATVNILAPTPRIRPSACVKIGHIIFLLFSNFMIRSNGNQLFLLKGSSSGQPCSCFYDFLGEIIMTPEINLYSSIFIDTDLLYQFPKFFWAVLIQKLNTLGICF